MYLVRRLPANKFPLLNNWKDRLTNVDFVTQLQDQLKVGSRIEIDQILTNPTTEAADKDRDIATNPLLDSPDDLTTVKDKKSNATYFLDLITTSSTSISLTTTGYDPSA